MALCLRACVCDIRRREIPNDVPVLLVATAIVFSIVRAGSLTGVLSAGWGPAVCLLVVGFI
ncbi:MAG: hypothetical protein Q4E62_08255 [Sutterellaceae bacterium]|nr:hypothetical protein [Sutterellaceae bacterium]